VTEAVDRAAIEHESGPGHRGSSFDGETLGGWSPWELTDRLVQAAVEAKVLGVVEHPVTLGRYIVERPLGAGGMGRLWLAFDAQLQRRVALKIVAPHLSESPEARARIVREARAMARLSDPHVAQIYEVDESGMQVFVAMEFVDGEDLRRWLDRKPRGWREVIDVFLQAGAGLAAAHDKGIVHRDFKPDNVMLEHDGRARVVDFGLARAGVDPERNPAGSSQSPGDISLTQTGALLGTPAYMAPEQWSGQAIDARSDQFSFCVALFEALAGRRPYRVEGDGDETIAGIRAAQEHGDFEPLPAAVPRFVARAVRRGLARDPRARWPDMRTLLRALDPVRRRRRRWLIATALVVVLSGWMLGSLHDPCRAAEAPIRTTWSDQEREAIAALAKLDLPWADVTSHALVTRFDTHADRWSQAARAVCATSEVASTSAGCLREMQIRLSDAIDRARTGDPAWLVGAVAEAELLPDPRACLEAPHIRAFAEDAPDATTARLRIAELERSLGALSTRNGSYRFAAAIRDGQLAASQAIAAAEAIDHAPVLARALWAAGRLRLRDGDAVGAKQQLRRALALAYESGDPLLGAAIRIDLVYALSRVRDRDGESQDLADAAAATLASVGHPPVSTARLLSHRASALAHAPNTDREEAVSLHEQAVALLHEALGPAHPDAIAAIGNLGAALNYAGRPVEGEARLAEAIAAADRVWGAEHPRTAVLVGALGLSRLRQDDLVGAEVNLRRSLAVREATLGTDHGEVDSARYNLATVLRRRHAHAEAIALLTQGWENRRRAWGPGDPGLAPWLVALGESELAMGNDAEARDHLMAASRTFERDGASADDFARLRLGLAQAWSTVDPERARVLAKLGLDDALEAHDTARRAEFEALLARF